MSPSWRDEVAVGLAPHRVELARRRRGFAPQWVATESIAVAGASSGADARDALAALAAALADPRWQGADCRVVLSNHYARYALIDWPQGLRGDDERAAALKLRFRSVYGEASERWTPVAAGRAVGGRALACAVDTALLDALAEAVRAARSRLVSVAPYLVAAWNRCHAALEGDALWFATLEPGRLGVAALAGERWAAVRNERVAGDPGEALAAVLAQEAAARDAAGAKVAYLYGPHWTGEPALPGPDWTARRVRAEPGGAPVAGAVDFALTLG